MRTLTSRFEQLIGASVAFFGPLHIRVKRIELLAATEPMFRIVLILSGLVYVTVVGIVDCLTPRGLDFILFYFLGCGLIAWIAGGRAAIPIALVSGLFYCFGDSHRGQPGWMTVWNIVFGFSTFLGVSLLIVGFGRLTRGLEDSVREGTERLQKKITEHRQAEEKFQQTLKLFQDVTENISEVFWVIDASRGQFEYVSPEFEKLWGRSRKGVYVSPAAWLEAVHQEDRERVGQTIWTQAVGEYDQEFRIVRPDRSVRWVRERGFPVKNERGDVCRIVGIVEDISERKKTDETLRTQSRVLECMAEAVLMSDAEGVIRLTNPAADFMLGYERGGLLGKSFSDISIRSTEEPLGIFRTVLESTKAPVSGGQPDKKKNNGQRLIETKVKTTEQWTACRKDGRQRLIESRSSSLNLGTEYHVVTVGQDITERVRMERQILEISDCEQARIGQDIHDGLCQNLISLAFDVNALAAGAPPEQTARFQRISDVLDQTITESRRVARGLYPVRLETEGLVSALKELAKSTSEHFGVRCSSCSSSEDVLWDSLSATHLYRIAQEAVTNAVKHSRGENIEIILDERDGEILLRVQDDGTGIARGPKSKSGMGMCIMEYRARSLGGVLHVQMGGENGTLVSCRVPRAMKHLERAQNGKLFSHD